MPGAKLHVTKLAAAGRQLRAAIRMYFSGEDELAIHTVAAASYRLLADLKAERGMDEAANVYLTSIFYVVRDFRRGSLPQHLTTDPDFMAWVEALAEQLPIRADSNIEDVSVVLSREAASEFWKRRNKVANFLKHADRDAGAAIALDEVDNLLLLKQCYSAYTDLTPEELGNAGLVFQLFIGANQAPQPNPASQRDQIIQKLAAAREQDRRQMCSIFITELNKMDRGTNAAHSPRVFSEHV
jgi:hypothetical protein